MNTYVSLHNNHNNIEFNLQLQNINHSTYGIGIYYQNMHMCVHSGCNTTSLISYHDLTERTHFHDILELFIHIS